MKNRAQSEKWTLKSSSTVYLAQAFTFVGIFQSDFVLIFQSQNRSVPSTRKEELFKY